MNDAGTAGPGGVSFIKGAGWGVQQHQRFARRLRRGRGASQSGTFNAAGGGGFDGVAAVNTTFTPAAQIGNGSVELVWQPNACCRCSK